MSDEAQKFKKLFTIEEANATLPLVRAICTDLKESAQELFRRQQALRALDQRESDAIPDPYREEVAQSVEDLDRDVEQLRAYAQELQELGILLKDPQEGLVDFPSLLDDRVVFLCWKLGEPEVLYWHDLDAGFSGRQPLLAEASAGGEYPDSSLGADE